jgi:hypothetical protein
MQFFHPTGLVGDKFAGSVELLPPLLVTCEQTGGFALLRLLNASARLV